jgi:alpha-tubulin suppressor-like RCC1 family protein
MITKNGVRWPGLVFDSTEKRLRVLVVLVFTAQLFLIGCGSSLNKKDSDARANIGNDSGPGDTANGTGGSGDAGGRGGSGGIGDTSDGGGIGGAGGTRDSRGIGGTSGTSGAGGLDDAGGTSGAGGLDDAGGSGESGNVGDADVDRPSVSTSPAYTCAIKTTGALFCWGYNGFGDIGNNSTTDSLLPVQESTAASDWANVSTGGTHTCAIKTNGELYCWGDNHLGELGNNTTTVRYVPVQESTVASDWANVSGGYKHTCAIKTNGTLFCWGYNQLGQLGTNSNQDSHVPVQESTASTDWARVSAGQLHTCAIKTNGTLFCWGSDEYSQLGNNSTDSLQYFERYTPPSSSTIAYRPIPMQEGTGATDWARVSAGDKHTCAIKTNGTLFCWGDNEDGMLGNNSNKDSHVPVQESAGATDWARVSASNNHTCAIKTNGMLFCWGNNEYGQLGNNSTTNSLVPVQESTAATDWANLSAGGSHTCAIKTNGTLFCWGYNSQGEFGDNSTTNSLVPVPASIDLTK